MADTWLSQETMNFWRQTNHVMSFFKEENFRGEKRLPSNFISGFLEVGDGSGQSSQLWYTDARYLGSQLECGVMPVLFIYVYKDNGRDPSEHNFLAPSI